MSILYLYIGYLFVCVIAALLIRRYVALVVRVEGHSMMNTLKNGQFFIALRYNRHRRPKRGDIAVCRFNGQKKLYLKRIVGLPGETIACERGVVFINGEPLPEIYARCIGMRRTLPMALGSDAYFMLGDNRPCSRDSRAMGPIREEDLLARGVLRILPFKERGRLI